MPATAEKKRRASPRKKKAPAAKMRKKSALAIWWPLLLGIIATPFATRAAGIFALEGPSALRMLYPYVLLIKEPLFHLPADTANTISQGMIYAQFPLYGLLMSLLLRTKPIGFAFAAVAVIHIAGILALLLR
jgi:hypothetical protein